jgi:hypothetical protein
VTNAAGAAHHDQGRAVIDAMFQAGTDQALDDQVQRRRPLLPTPPGVFAGFGAAIPRALGGAGAEMAAFGAEIAGAFGQVAGAYPEILGGPLTDQQKREAESARRKVLDAGVDYSSPAGDTLRAKAKDIMPDPATTGAAGQVIGGLVGFGAKALGYGLTLGPAGPLALAGDVGLTESDRLKQQGVDLETRTKAGGAAGVMAGASVVVPMTGATAFVRGAKGVAVGESAIVGQSLAERAILRAAGYDKIGDTFDPLDPVALAVGLVPGALGAKFGHAPPSRRRPPPARGRSPRWACSSARRCATTDVQLDAYAVEGGAARGHPARGAARGQERRREVGAERDEPRRRAGRDAVHAGHLASEFGHGDPLDPVNSIDAGAQAT